MYVVLNECFLTSDFPTKNAFSLKMLHDWSLIKDYF